MKNTTQEKGRKLRRDKRSGAIINSDREALASEKLLKQRLYEGLENERKVRELESQFSAVKGENTKLRNKLNSLEETVNSLLQDKQDKEDKG